MHIAYEYTETDKLSINKKLDYLESIKFLSNC